MSVAHDKLVYRVRTAMTNIGPEHLTLDELCRVVPILERAADREAGHLDGQNVITFGACRRRRAKRVASRKQSGDAD